uniref:Uncharacterized protein n=1 Tax=Globisporangium ultimum (strain ATCC 200006 / CBS 805.95 / DAOM BR144) TaxID=431595 RepID=K3WYG4_GLOUD
MEDIKSTPVVHVDTQVVVADDTFVVASRSSDSTEKLEKPRRRRHSRRSRRSTATERLSAYDEFLLLEPILVASKATPSAADEDRTRYIAEAASVRSLQQTSAPFEIKSMTNPDLRLMVDEMNSMVSSMYSTLAGNWDFLASLSVVEEEKPTSPDVEAPATDVPAEECAEEDAALPEPEYED